MRPLVPHFVVDALLLGGAIVPHFFAGSFRLPYGRSSDGSLELPEVRGVLETGVGACSSRPCCTAFCPGRLRLALYLVLVSEIFR